jgi:hypothetical protein
MSSEILQWDSMSAADRLALKASCEGSFPLFLRYFFQLLQGQRFLWNWHHAVFCQLAEDIYNQKYDRVIVNCPPGSTKTEIWSIHWPAWCIIQNITRRLPSRWLPISYSDDLVTENASRVKDILDSEPFQALWPLTLSNTTRGKSDWLYEDTNGKQHRMFGTSLMGQVTGRRAGYMLERCFTGALVIDDPLPPRDEGGKRMQKSNQSLNKVVRSRLAHNKVPIVMIQQRIGNGDSTDFMMGDKSPDKYTLFKVPAMLDKVYFDSLPKNYQDAIVRDTGFDGTKKSYWEDKEPTESLKGFEAADPFFYSSQYQQAPDEALLEGVIYRREIDRMVADGRVCKLPIEPSLPVYTFWDLGISKGNSMSVWLMQPYRLDLRLIACYSKYNHDGIADFINWLIEFKKRYGIAYSEHYAPHDVEARNVMTGKKDMDTAFDLGITFERVPRVQSKRDSIEALRKLFPRLWVDEERCDIDPIRCEKVRGWEAIRKYHREWDADREIFDEKPYHDWTSNPADALQQMGLSWTDKSKCNYDHASQMQGLKGW